MVGSSVLLRGHRQDCLCYWTFRSGALLFGSVARIVLHPFRFAIVVHAIVIAALLPFPASPLQQEPAPASEQTFAALARQLSSDLQKKSVKRVFIMDFEDPNRNVTPFGAWLADQFSSAPGNPWAPIEIEEDRSSVAALVALSTDPGTLGAIEDKATMIGRLVGTTPVTGSYSAAENGIGVTLSGGGVQVIGKIAMTDEMKSHLSVPLDSLVPSDEIFEAGRGGISVPRCEYCPNPQYSDKATKRRIQGGISLLVVVSAEGRATTASIVKELGGGLDEAAVATIRTWKFNPGTNVDGKAVAVRVPIEVTFRLY
jgi:TonB family protein